MAEPNLPLNLARYSPVQRFALDAAPTPHAGVSGGYAAPADGFRGCALKLSSGGELFTLVKAWRYSETARVAGVQDGWAGFSLSGLLTAMAMGPPIELRCAVSGSLLATFERSDLPAEIEAPVRPFLPATKLTREIKSMYGCSDLQQMVGFGERVRSIQGDRALIQASYRWLLRRTCTDSEIRGFAADLKPEWGVAEIWGKFTSSDEFRNGWGMPLLGLHEPGFPFQLF